MWTFIFCVASCFMIYQPNRSLLQYDAIYRKIVMQNILGNVHGMQMNKRSARTWKEGRTQPTWWLGITTTYRANKWSILFYNLCLQWIIPVLHLKKVDNCGYHSWQSIRKKVSNKLKYIIRRHDFVRCCYANVVLFYLSGTYL